MTNMATATHSSPPPANAGATGTATVTVACKIPSGMRCRMHEKRRVSEVTLGGTREVEQYFATDKEFIVHGPAHAQNEGPRFLTVGGYALTRGVPKDLWDRWYEQNLELDAVQRNLIFAYENSDKTKDAAKDHRTIKTGLERLNPNSLPQLDQRFELKTADDAVAQIGNIDVE
jgi:hypothetical protein